MRIVHADLERGWAVTEDGAVVPVAWMADGDGQAVQSADEAEGFVIRDVRGQQFWFWKAHLVAPTLH